jgi:transposase
VGAHTEQAMADVVRAQVAVLVPIVTQITELTRRIEQFMLSLPDGLLVMSFPRAGQVCAAQILAELGDVRERFPSADQLAAEAGTVPVTYQSGKTRSVAFRWACNHRLRQAITCLADNSRHANAWAKGLCQAARARGCDHTHAIRILVRAWLRIIWRAWTDRKPYDPVPFTATPSRLHSRTQGG